MSYEISERIVHDCFTKDFDFSRHSTCTNFTIWIWIFSSVVQDFHRFRWDHDLNLSWLKRRWCREDRIRIDYFSRVMSMRNHSRRISFTLRKIWPRKSFNSFSTRNWFSPQCLGREVFTEKRKVYQDSQDGMKIEEKRAFDGAWLRNTIDHDQWSRHVFRVILNCFDVIKK